MGSSSPLRVPTSHRWISRLFLGLAFSAPRARASLKGEQLLQDRVGGYGASISDDGFAGLPPHHPASVSVTSASSSTGSTQHSAADSARESTTTQALDHWHSSLSPVRPNDLWEPVAGFVTDDLVDSSFNPIDQHWLWSAEDHPYLPDHHIPSQQPPSHPQTSPTHTEEEHQLDHHLPLQQSPSHPQTSGTHNGEEEYRQLHHDVSLQSPSYPLAGGVDNTYHTNPSFDEPADSPMTQFLLDSLDLDDVIPLSGKGPRKRILLNTQSSIQMHFQQHLSEPFRRSYLTPRGVLLLPLLLHHEDTFKQKIDALNSMHTERMIQELHPTLDQYELHRNEELQWFEAITKSNSRASEDTVHLYKLLIVFMHKLHEEYLDKLGIDLVTQVEHQEKMLLWLDGELFDQIDGLPVLAFSRKFNPLHGNIFTHHSLGPIQKQLIMYFSQDKDSLDLLPYTGHFVLKNFNDQHQTEQSLLQPPPRDEVASGHEITNQLAQILMAIVKHIILDPSSESDDITSKMIEQLSKSFEEQVDRLDIETSQTIYTHPDLPIEVVESKFLTQVHRSQQIRISRAPNSTPIKPHQAAKTMAGLLEEVDLFHRQILDRMAGVDISVPDPRARRKMLLVWLIQSYLKPTQGLPIQGLVPIRADEAPWDDYSSAEEAFGPIQRQLIRIFSKAPNGPKLNKYGVERASIVAAWYSSHHPDEIFNLVNQLKARVNKKRKRT